MRRVNVERMRRYRQRTRTAHQLPPFVVTLRNGMGFRYNDAGQWPEMSRAQLEETLIGMGAEKVTWLDETTCHCGRPVHYGFDGDPTHHRGMCFDCDEIRCDAYPDQCPWRFDFSGTAP